jgi:hypothetical protein
LDTTRTTTGSLLAIRRDLANVVAFSGEDAAEPTR